MSTFIRESPRKAYASKVGFDCSFLPPHAAIESVTLMVNGVANVPAAGFSAVQQRLMLKGFEFETSIRTTGLGMQAQDAQQRGRDTVPTADIAQNATAALSVAHRLEFRDVRGLEPSDHSRSTDEFIGKTLNVFLEAAATLVASMTFDAATECWLEFVLSPLSPGKVPTAPVIDYVDVIGKTIDLPGGFAYSDLVLVKNDGTAITDAELADVTIKADGQTTTVEKSRLATFLRRFNSELCPDTASAVAAASATRVPLYFDAPPAKGTKLLNVAGKLQVFITGTLTPGVARVFYRAYRLEDVNARTARARAMWGAGVKGVVSKTASKNGVDASVRGPLPGIASRAA